MRWRRTKGSDRRGGRRSYLRCRWRNGRNRVSSCVKAASGRTDDCDHNNQRDPSYPEVPDGSDGHLPRAARSEAGHSAKPAPGSHHRGQGGTGCYPRCPVPAPGAIWGKRRNPCVAIPQPLPVRRNVPYRHGQNIPGLTPGLNRHICWTNYAPVTLLRPPPNGQTHHPTLPLGLQSARAAVGCCQR